MVNEKLDSNQSSCEKEDKAQMNKERVEMLKSHRDQFKLQQEIMNQWFRYYLLIIGAPFPILGALLKTETVIRENAFYLAIIAFFLFGVGLLSFLMSVRQRINTIQTLKERIFVIEKLLYEELFKNKKYSEFPIHRYGADFYFALIYVFINSVWCATGIYFLWMSCAVSKPWIWVGLLASAIAQYIVRFLMLYKYEKEC